MYKILMEITEGRLSVTRSSYQVKKRQFELHHEKIAAAIDLIEKAKNNFYTGGGVINSGSKASELLTKFVRETGYQLPLH